MDYLDRLADTAEPKSLLEANLELLAEARTERDNFANAQRQREAELNADVQLQEYKVGKSKWQAAVEKLENEIRDLALKNPEHLPNGVTIKQFKVAHIFDVNAAREWSMKNFTPALTLDIKVFEKALVQGQIPAELGEVKMEARAQIASNLQEYAE